MTVASSRVSLALLLVTPHGVGSWAPAARFIASPASAAASPAARARRSSSPALHLREDDDGETDAVPVRLPRVDRGRRGARGSRSLQPEHREMLADLLDDVYASTGSAEETCRVWRAFCFSHWRHRHQVRASGEPYVTHPLQVASILASQRMDVSSIITGLLHDTVEDTGATTELVSSRFGAEVASLVDGVTKLTRLQMAKRLGGQLLAPGGGELLAPGEPATAVADDEVQPRPSRAQSEAENFRKLVLAMSSDIRVLLVKLTDRLHNMRTLRFVPSADSRRRKAQETLAIYAPLADRLGMSSLTLELETLAFRELHPEEYGQIVAEQYRHHYSPELQSFLRTVHSTLGLGNGLGRPPSRNVTPRMGEGEGEAVDGGDGAAAASPTPTVEPPVLTELHLREESAYRIWRRLVESGQRPEELRLRDYIHLVLVAPTVPACYTVLGAMHGACRSLGEIRDYISTPKPNHYQSLHTTVLGPEMQLVDLSIRTPQMHRLAELGVVALWHDEGAGGTPWRSAQSHHSGWVSSLLAISDTAVDADDFLELSKAELFPDQVYCFSPRGGVIRLPRGATPLDFAYAVHSSLGHRCHAALVNGRSASIHSPLRNGDMVQIVPDDAQEPTPAWEGKVASGKARAEIRRFVNSKRRQALEYYGRARLATAIEEEGLEEEGLMGDGVAAHEPGAEATSDPPPPPGLALASTAAALRALEEEVHVAGGVVLGCLMRRSAPPRRGGEAGHAPQAEEGVELELTLELRDPKQLRNLLASVRSLPAVEQVCEVRSRVAGS